MSAFCLLSRTDKLGFCIARCHVNVWHLQGLYGRPRLYFDLGLHVKPATREVPGDFTVDMLLPFTTSDYAPCLDLRDRLKDDQTQWLLFESSAGTSDAVRYDNADVGFAHVNCEIVRDGKPPRGGSLWRLTVPKEEQGGASGFYVRVRFRVRDSRHLLSWRYFWLTGSIAGCLLDLRVNDLRSVADFQHLRGQERRILRIAELRVFFVLPDWLRLRTTSFPLHYVRTCEGAVWNAYLGRPIALASRMKPIVYQWKCDKPVERGRPAYVFAAFDSNRCRLWAVVRRVVLVAAICTIGVFLVSPDSVELARRAAGPKAAWIAGFMVATAWGKSILSVTRLLRLDAIKAAGIVRRFLLWVEDTVYGLRLPAFRR